jgi:hypothetical protein
MTRHRKDDEDGLDGDAPWRAGDYDRAARPPDAPVTTRRPGAAPQARRARPGVR